MLNFRIIKHVFFIINDILYTFQLIDFNRQN